MIHVSYGFDSSHYVKAGAGDCNISALFTACNTVTVVSKVEFHR